MGESHPLSVPLWPLTPQVTSLVNHAFLLCKGAVCSSVSVPAVAGGVLHQVSKFKPPSSQRNWPQESQSVQKPTCMSTSPLASELASQRRLAATSTLVVPQLQKTVAEQQQVALGDRDERLRNHMCRTHNIDSDIALARPPVGGPLSVV